MDEQLKAHDETERPIKERKTRRYNRPPRFYQRLGSLGGSAPHNRPPGHYQRIGALGGGDHRKSVGSPAPTNARLDNDTSHGEQVQSETKRNDREPVEPRGELTMREACRLAGEATAAKYGRECLSENGRKGGEKVRDTDGSEHYERIWKIGGSRSAHPTRPKGYYGEIGRRVPPLAGRARGATKIAKSDSHAGQTCDR